MRRQDLLHGAGGKPVAGDVDDVVGARHHEDVAVLVDEAGIGRLVVAREFLQVGLDEPLVVVPQGGQGAGRHGPLGGRAPISPAFTGCLSEPSTARFHPGTALVGEPSFTGKWCRPRQFPAMADRSRSATSGRSRGVLRLCWAQRRVSGSKRSPARKRVLKAATDRRLFHEPPHAGLSRLMARKAVGAVKRHLTPCCKSPARTRRRPACRPACPRRGCVVHPLNRGP